VKSWQPGVAAERPGTHGSVTKVWTAISIVLMLGGPAVWFFGLRTSELAVQSPRHLYVLQVPRTYFMRERIVKPIVTEAGTVDMATLVAAAIGSEPRGYALAYVELLPAEISGRTEEAIIDDALRGGAEVFGTMDAQPETMSVGGRPGRGARFVGTFEGRPMRGQLRGVYVEGEVVVVMALCGAPGCETDADRLRVLDGFAIR
jgi:hypothetical protein